jgi:hypothetical protein
MDGDVTPSEIEAITVAEVIDDKRLARCSSASGGACASYSRKFVSMSDVGTILPFGRS